MSEEPESQPGSGGGDEDPASDPDPDAAGESAAESDDSRSDDGIPGGSIHDYLDDDQEVALDAEAPAGDTGMADPVPEEDRVSVSDAVGAPAPDGTPDEDPDLELDPVLDTEGDGDGGANPGGFESAATPTTTTPETGSAEWSDAEADGVTVGGDPDDPVDDGLLGEAPPSDQEMPLADHIEEMVRRLGIVLVLAGIVTAVAFPVADDLINYLWNTHIPGATTVEGRRPRLYGPLELLVTELKVAALAGFIVGLPVFVYQTYQFMRPGLFPRERRYYLAAVPTSLVLAFVGVAFAHFAVLPAIFAYFTAYTTGTATVAFGLKETFGLILVLMGYMALVFQIPLFIMLAIMMNLTTRAWLEQKRLLFWGGFLGLSFLVSPDPTGMAPIIVAATMITLFEGTLALLRWTGN
jgi:sec-independent protein translocase protein TatC